jgi:hypothetical protein
MSRLNIGIPSSLTSRDGAKQQNQQKTNNKKSGVTNEKIKYSNPYHASPHKRHGYHRVGSKPTLPQL